MSKAMLRILAVSLLSLPFAAAAGRRDLSGAENWAVWLQGADPSALAASPYDVVVIDYSRDGSAAAAYTPVDLARLHAAGKTVLAYLSIGEAEDYRFYWKRTWKPGRPSFLAEENPEWPGNYAVRYWSPDWWTQAIRPYLDRILAAGFDGVYLDRVDAYWWWYEHGVAVRTSANRMVTLVEQIAAYARRIAGTGFVVCPQNGLAILDDASSSFRSRYLACIDAVGVESLFYGYWDLADQAYRIQKLREFAAAGKRIFDLEYMAPKSWSEYRTRLASQSFGMAGYAAAPDRLLDELVLWD